MTAYPIELYKLTYAGTTDAGKDYTLSDAQSMVTIENICDENLDGSQITMSLFIGNMHLKQIIHYKADGTKEYFYDENSEYAQNGAKAI